MFKSGVKFLGVAVLLLVAGLFLFSSKAKASANQSLLFPPSSADLVRRATVRILLFIPAAGQEGEAETYTFTTALGTRVKDGSRSLIVTHDHWGEALEQAAFVHFYSSDNRLLVELPGDAFRNQILYRDQGTMILRAPHALPGLAQLGDPGEVKVGDRVTLVNQVVSPRPESGLVQVKAARVQEQGEFNGRDSFTLVSLDGRPMVHGDSGGGIWHNGRLVGNMWATKTGLNWQVWTWESLEQVTVETDESIGAAFPVTNTRQQSELNQVYHLQQTIIGPGS